jgi:hypothetical protein
VKVRELQELLATLPPEAEVILAKDGEGNGFSPCADHSPQYRYEADSTWSGELVSDPNADDADEDELDPERWSKAVPCVVLWPVN